MNPAAFMPLVRFDVAKIGNIPETAKQIKSFFLNLYIFQIILSIFAGMNGKLRSDIGRQLQEIRSLLWIILALVALLFGMTVGRL